MLVMADRAERKGKGKENKEAYGKKGNSERVKPSRVRIWGPEGSKLGGK